MTAVRRAVAVMMVVVLVTFVLTVVEDDSDAASGSARVFIDGDVEYSGSGSTVENIIVGALSNGGHSVEKNANGTIKSVDGKTSDKDHTWMIYQWVPPEGWKVTYMTKTGDASFVSGTSYYVHYATRTSGDSVGYTVPDFQPTSVAYFYIVFNSPEDVNNGTDVTEFFDQEQREKGFWISGTGSNAAWAFKDACDKYGLELNMSDGVKDGETNLDYIGWLFSFMGLVDINLGNGDYRYWSQYHYESGKWMFSETLGHYDPGVCKYYGFVRQVTKEDQADNMGPKVLPSSCPKSLMTGGCTVTFIDGDGKETKQKVDYFGTVSAPTTSKKTSTDTTDYEFIGWDRDLDGMEIISNITVHAQFKEVPRENVPVTGVSISNAPSDLGVGKSAQLRASVSPSNAMNKAVSWASSDSSVLTVSSDGTVYGKAEGTATVTVKTADGGFTDSVRINVTSKTVPVQSIALSNTSMKLKEGDSGTLTCTFSPSNATDRGLTWTSSDTDVVTVEGGEVTAVGPGTATVTAKASDGGFTASCEVTVAAEGEFDGTLTISCSAVILQKGDEITISVDVEPSSESGRVKWAVSSGPDVVSVSGGTVKALKEGTAIVTAYIDDVLASCQVTVVDDVKELAEKLRVIDLTGIDDTEYIVSVTKDQLLALVDADFDFNVKTRVGDVTFSTDAVKTIAEKYNETLFYNGIPISIGYADLNEAQKAAADGATVYSLSVSNGNISKFGGDVTVSLPYEGETKGIKAFHLADDGTLTAIDCTYDPETGMATFVTDHFSEYFIGTSDAPLPDQPGDDSGSMVAIGVVAAVVLLGIVAVVLLKRNKA